jgi:hypothetical protein
VTTDFIVRPHGSIWTFEPASEAAKDFTATDLDVQGWQWLGPAFGVEHLLANHLVAALEVEGFLVGLG